MCEKGWAYFDNVSMFALDRPILLVGVGTRDMMRNADVHEE